MPASGCTNAPRRPDILPKTMIRAFDISKSFGRTRAVREVSFELEPGQVAGLLGPNGAGKSTTIRMITGFVCPDAGSVSIAGFDTIDQPGQARRRLGYLPEAAPCYPEMRAMDYLVHRARLQGLPRRAARRAADEAARRCRLEPAMARKRFAALSKGYRQRVGLAAALVHDPSVLVLDEPTNGLDPGQIREARSLIRELAHNRTMLVSSHILPEIERTCDRVIIIAGGRIRADGPPETLAAAEPTRLRIEFRPAGDADALVAALRAVPGVSDAQEQPAGDGWRTLTARAAPDAHDRVAALLHESRAIVRTLAADRPTLEDAFVRLTEEAPA
jgi:ABC-2 type transport system ATP-binding protein